MSKLIAYCVLSVPIAPRFWRLKMTMMLPDKKQLNSWCL